MFLDKGQPKSLYRPGSSTDVLLFEPGRVRFAPDIVANLRHRDVQSRFTTGFGAPLAETRSASARCWPPRRSEHGNLLFFLSLGVGLSLLLIVSFRVLPRERWQILAAVPLRRDENGRWLGVNLTTYGFLLASGTTFAAALFLVLLGSLGLSAPIIAALMTIVLGGAIPAAKLVARLVEGKRNTLTIGGASFVGLLLMPVAVALVNRFLLAPPRPEVALLPVLAALTTAYVFGEGIGRLACISFGCCYGKPLSETSPLTRHLCRRCHFIFHGETKKIAYAAGLDGVEVVPIQAVTATLYVTTGMVGLWLFLMGGFTAALLVTLLVSQGWRAFSENLRADYRGAGRLSAYQLMSLAATAIGPLALFWLPVDAHLPPPELTVGFAVLWNPPVLLILQGLWLFLFLYTGCSKVTGASLDFHVHRERI